MKSAQNSEAANLNQGLEIATSQQRVGKFSNAKSKIRERNPKGDAEGNRLKPTQPTQKFSIDKPVGCYASQLWRLWSRERKSPNWPFSHSPQRNRYFPKNPSSRMPKMASDPSAESTHTNKCSPSTCCTLLRHQSSKKISLNSSWQLHV